MYSENESGFLVSGVRGQDTDLSSSVASLLGYALGVELEAYGVKAETSIQVINYTT